MDELLEFKNRIHSSRLDDQSLRDKSHSSRKMHCQSDQNKL